MKRLFLTFAVLGGLFLSSFTTKAEKVQAYAVTITNSCGMTATYNVTDGTFYDMACYWEDMCD